MNDPNMKLLDVAPDVPVEVPAYGKLPKTVHVFEQLEIDAINAALASGRPLLVRGLPGVGKSQLARAAAAELGRAFVSTVVDAQVETDDLKWSFDTVERLAQAQLQQAIGADAKTARKNLDAKNFLRPGPLWWAFDWGMAEDQAKKTAVPLPEHPAKWQQDHGCVLLIDEIDKADSSVPNGLLECLGAGVFHAPGGLSISRNKAQQPPLVVVTTNEERVLPDAFLRRCMVVQLELPADEKKLIERLVARGKAHVDVDAPPLAEDTLREAAKLLAEDRRRARGQNLCPPGQAEYLDLCRAIAAMAKGDATREAELLGRMRGFAYDKHPGADRT